MTCARVNVFKEESIWLNNLKKTFHERLSF